MTIYQIETVLIFKTMRQEVISNQVTVHNVTHLDTKLRLKIRCSRDAKFYPKIKKCLGKTQKIKISQFGTHSTF